jgi:hypothetical protein
MIVMVNSPNKTPKKVVKKAALTMGKIFKLRDQNYGFEGILLNNNGFDSFSPNGR